MMISLGESDDTSLAIEPLSTSTYSTPCQPPMAKHPKFPFPMEYLHVPKKKRRADASFQSRKARL